jgi:hypothetical protein
MTQRKRNRNAWTKWRRLISEQMRSGKSVAAFCREQKLRASHFYWWKKRLRENTAARFVELQVAESPANLPGDSRIEVRLQNPVDATPSGINLLSKVVFMIQGKRFGLSAAQKSDVWRR